MKKLNPKEIIRIKILLHSIHFKNTRIKANNKMHESSTKRTRLKWVEDRNTLVNLDRLVTRHTLSARRPLLDIVINILKPEASSWATMTQLVRGPDCRAPFPPLLPPCTPVITFLCLLSRPARRSQRKKHGDR